MPDFTKFLNQSSNSSDEELYTAIYRELQIMARGKMAMESPGHTLNATALVHEAWIRIEKSKPENWRDRKQFYAAASEAMRRILVEAARKRLAQKRGGGQAHTELQDDTQPLTDLPDERIVALHDVLDQLEKTDPTQAQIVKLRFFSGLQNQEIANIMEVNEKTIRRHWNLAKVWLYRAMDA